ncbi:MAG: helix-turn-helix transcriptional regulator [Cyanobacteriota/Melainabacteria group bacterium]|nr:helix-turn-helix transcriptional regulator [Cyanobacteria bacterium HKST-UBA01]MCB9472080.1 helix-turn-helix transcriptional regulator [Candidatus Obscuribacterales bacterium]
MLNQKEEELMEALSSLIAQKRQANSWSEEDLARTANLSARRVRALETGRENFSLDVLSKLARAFNQSVLDLIAEAEDFRNG